MKRGIAALLTLLLCLSAFCALADDYGKAIIDGGNAYKVHLREEPSALSDSIGVYFTGTRVTLKSDPAAEWVEVKIGRLQGYMRGIYLKRGEAGDRVTPRFWNGEVDATRYARMRYGPSTEYQFLRNVNDGEEVAIMGEVDNWYFVEYKGERGFISANLVYTRGAAQKEELYDEEAYEEEVYEPVYTPALSWQDAYRSYVLQHADESDTFALIYVNDDSIPELVIDSGVEAQGCRILTYAAGEVNALATRRLGFTYIERGNRLCNSNGLMNEYFDDVYEIRNGRWVCLARGEYFGYLSGWNDILQRYVCRNYIWNGQKTTIDQYLIALDAVYDGQRAVGVEEGYSLSGILTQL